MLSICYQMGNWKIKKVSIFKGFAGPHISLFAYSHSTGGLRLLRYVVGLFLPYYQDMGVFIFIIFVFRDFFAVKMRSREKDHKILMWPGFSGSSSIPCFSKSGNGANWIIPEGRAEILGIKM